MNFSQEHHQLFFEDTTLRDGLQSESRIFSLEEKRVIFEKLKIAGFQQIQVGSFVHPNIVPQMADTDELIQIIGKQSKTIVSALVLNEIGLKRAITCKVAHVNMSVSVSDTHSRKNIRQPANKALAAMVGLIKKALKADLKLRAGLQCVFGCVDEGMIAEKTIMSAVEKLVEAGATQINLADTTGMATPFSIDRLIRKLDKAFGQIRISLHLHNTRGLGLANVWAGYQTGIRSFDVCAGGLGGCPFIKGAAGNIPAEDAVNMFETSGIKTHINLTKLCDTVGYLESKLGRKLPGHMYHVLANPS